MWSFDYGKCNYCLGCLSQTHLIMETVIIVLGVCHKNTTGGDVPLSPLAGPILTPASLSNFYHFRVSVPDHGVPTGSTDRQTFAVNFLFKVVDIEENITWYYWQVSNRIIE